MIVIPLIALALIKLSRLAALSSDALKITLIVFLAVITPSASTVTQMCQVYGNDEICKRHQCRDHAVRDCHDAAYGVTLHVH